MNNSKTPHMMLNIDHMTFRSDIGKWVKTEEYQAEKILAYRRRTRRKEYEFFRQRNKAMRDYEGCDSCMMRGTCDRTDVLECTPVYSEI